MTAVAAVPLLCSLWQQLGCPAKHLDTWRAVAALADNAQLRETWGAFMRGREFSAAEVTLNEYRRRVDG